MSKKKPKVAKLELKPTTIGTPMGSSRFDPSTGEVSTQLGDRQSQFRNLFYNEAEDAANSNYLTSQGTKLSEYGRLFTDRGLGMDVQDRASTLFGDRLALLSEARAEEEARLKDTLFSTGRTGYGTGVSGGYVNPEQFALQTARARADANLLLQSEEAARAEQDRYLNMGSTLFSQGEALQDRRRGVVEGLFGLGNTIDSQNAQMLNPTLAYAGQQMNTQMALQANQQARNNAKASGGGFFSSLAGAAGTAIGSSFGGPVGAKIGGVVGSAIGGGSGGGFSSLFSSIGDSWRTPPYVPTYGTNGSATGQVGMFNSFKF